MRSYDFFAAQDNARRRSFWLRIVFLISLVIFSAVTGFCISYLLSIDVKENRMSSNLVLPDVSEVQFFLPAIFVFLIIMLGAAVSGRRIKKMGIEGFLEFSGAERILAPFKDSFCQQCHNVVHEMSVASGVPFPKLFYLPRDNSINAFTAGTTTSDICIVVTAGAVQHLSRAELQGVIAHEFSHILNGDVKTNIDLVSWIHGYSFISMMGRPLMDRRRIDIMTAVGFFLLVAGFLGEFAAAIIRSGYSVQREWLADAAAVQFTRNPEGLRGALQKVDLNVDKRIIGLRDSDSFAHMFFTDGIDRFLSNLFRTHPPLQDRIRSLGLSRYNSPADTVHFKPRNKQVDSDVSQETRSGKPANSGQGLAQKDTSFNPSAVGRAGQFDAESVAFAATVLQELPSRFSEDLHVPLKARGIVAAAVVFYGSSDRNAVILEISSRNLFSQAITDYIRDDVFPLLKRVNFLQGLALMDLACEQLGRQKNLNKFDFLLTLIAIVKNDGNTTPQELVMLIYGISRLLSSLEMQRIGVSEGQADPRSDIAQLTAFVAHAGAPDNLSKAGNAYELAMGQFGWPHQPLPPVAGLQTEALLRAVGHIRGTPPKTQKKFLTAIAQAISLDKQINAAEHALLRAICTSLGCPLPLEGRS
ncbi:MAG: hypothetical protein EBR09_03875 [Proteobacteria bacterium]|nr:hypothetical protein [Pseudomonadota bacterium]